MQEHEEIYTEILGLIIKDQRVSDDLRLIAGENSNKIIKLKALRVAEECADITTLQAAAVLTVIFDGRAFNYDFIALLELAITAQQELFEAGEIKTLRFIEEYMQGIEDFKRAAEFTDYYTVLMSEGVDGFKDYLAKRRFYIVGGTQKYYYLYQKEPDNGQK